MRPKFFSSHRPNKVNHGWLKSPKFSDVFGVRHNFSRNRMGDNWIGLVEIRNVTVVGHIQT